MEKYEVSLFYPFEKRPYKTINLWDWLLNTEPLNGREFAARTAKNHYELTRKVNLLEQISVSGIYNLKNSKVIFPTRLICIEFHLNDNRMYKSLDDIKNAISKSEYVMYTGISIIRNLLYCIIKIKEPREPIEHINALDNYFLSEFELIRFGRKFDYSKTIPRIYDDNPYVNANSTVYIEQQICRTRIPLARYLTDHRFWI